MFTWPCCRLGFHGVAGTLGVLVTHHPSPRSCLLSRQDLHATPTQMRLAKLSIPRSPALPQASPQALHSSVGMSEPAASRKPASPKALRQSACTASEATQTTGFPVTVQSGNHSTRPGSIALCCFRLQAAQL